jgi:hypothetical protein
MPRVGFESTAPVFELAKTVHALDRAAIVIGKHSDKFTDTAENIPSISYIRSFHIKYCRDFTVPTDQVWIGNRIY